LDQRCHVLLGIVKLSAFLATQMELQIQMRTNAPVTYISSQYMQSSSSRFVSNIVPLQNVQTNLSGQSQLQVLQTNVISLQAAVQNLQVAVQNIQSSTSTSLQTTVDTLQATVETMQASLISLQLQVTTLQAR